MGRVRIWEFTTAELEVFRKGCNFTDEELEYFNLKAKNVSHVAIAMEMNISTAKVCYIAKHVVSKIHKVQEEQKRGGVIYETA